MAEMKEAAFSAGTGAVGIGEQDIPLAFRIVENLPGIAAAAGFMAFRGANTLIEGGRFDYRKGSRFGEKFRVINQDNEITGINTRQFFGGGNFATAGGTFKGGRLGRRAARKKAIASAGSVASGFAGTSNFNLRAARANIATANPRALRRLGSLTSFMGAEAGMYSPFAASTLLGSRGPLRKRAINKMGITAVEGQSVFGPGLLSFITAGTKIDRLERKALGGSQRALNKLGRVDQNIRTLAGVNNPRLLLGATGGTPMAGTPLTNLTTNKAGKVVAPKGGIDLLMPDGTIKNYGSGKFLPKNPMLPNYGPTIPSASVIDNALRVGVREELVAGQKVIVGNAGMRGNLMASSMAGAGTRYAAGYFRGSLGYGKAMAYEGLDEAAKRGARSAEKRFVTAFGKAGLGTRSMAYEALAPGNLIKTLRASESGVMKGLVGIATKGGAGTLAARAGALAIPGLNILATASLVYDLGKMAGEVIKSGINLARDANKSLQGTINKPLFGMGYRDTEAAATSRARGVMAIQNSRLNARSMLGSEAAMMAAHYG